MLLAEKLSILLQCFGIPSSLSLSLLRLLSGRLPRRLDARLTTPTQASGKSAADAWRRSEATRSCWLAGEKRGTNHVGEYGYNNSLSKQFFPVQQCIVYVTQRNMVHSWLHLVSWTTVVVTQQTGVLRHAVSRLACHRSFPGYCCVVPCAPCPTLGSCSMPLCAARHHILRYTFSPTGATALYSQLRCAFCLRL